MSVLNVKNIYTEGAKIDSTGTYIASEFNEIGGPTQNLLGYYKFDDNVVDYTGRYNGTNLGCSYITGKAGKALYVDSTNYATSPIFAGTVVLTQVSISCWVSASQTWYQQLISTTAATQRLNVHYSWMGTIYWDFGDGTYDRVSIAHTTDSSWHHWVFTYGSDGQYIYRDATCIVSNANQNSKSATLTGTTLHFGSIGGSYPLLGGIDEFRIYDRQLNINEIYSLYTMAPPNLYIESNGIVDSHRLIE